MLLLEIVNHSYRIALLKLNLLSNTEIFCGNMLIIKSDDRKVSRHFDFILLQQGKHFVSLSFFHLLLITDIYYTLIFIYISYYIL